MKGKYINTVIMLAALSGKKARRQSMATAETLAALADHQIIWSKDRATQPLKHQMAEMA